jgi:alpha-methylacyl-CoA racemase
MDALALDLTRLLPGPLAAQILAAIGFRVMRLVPPQGDLLERTAPAVHAWLNAGKKTEVIDLKTAEGRERLVSLAQEAQVLLESNLPGVMERLGVGPEVLRAANHRLVYVRVAGYRDPLLHKSPGHDLTYLAAAGLLPRLGSAWKEVQLADVSGAFWAVIAALDGLRRGGGFYEIYLEEAARVFANPGLPFLDGSRVCYTLYPSLEGEVALAALEPHLWERFCRAMSREEWLDRAFTPASSDNPVYREICAVLSTRKALEWDSWARETAVPLRAVRHHLQEGPLLPWKANP